MHTLEVMKKKRRERWRGKKRKSLYFDQRSVQLISICEIKFDSLISEEYAGMLVELFELKILINWLLWRKHLLDLGSTRIKLQHTQCDAFAAWFCTIRLLLKKYPSLLSARPQIFNSFYEQIKSAKKEIGIFFAFRQQKLAS